MTIENVLFMGPLAQSGNVEVMNMMYESDIRIKTKHIVMMQVKVVRDIVLT